jgi:hypothetical protein
MRVCGEDLRGEGAGLRGSQDAGVSPTAMNLRKDEGGAVGRGYPERAEPDDMDPDEKRPRGL